MSYKALYRTYRPMDFNEVAGQKHITTTLKNALKNGKVAHAYLFSGPRGTGKTSIAKILAKAVNCEKAPVENPCNVCPNCLGIQDGTINDVIEIDAASNNGVDEIREIRDKVRYLPGYVKYKVYIIDEVHMLSTGAFNALLKTLEEPPAHVIFILCTTEPQKIPLTIHSRCQRFDFKAITPQEITEKLHEIIELEHIQIEEAAVEQIAQYAEGGLRDALGLLDQAYSYSPNFISIDDVNQICGALSLQMMLDIVRAIIQMNASEAIRIMDELLISGKEVQKIGQNLLQFFRDLLIYKNVGFTDSTPKLYNNEEFITIAKSLNNRRLYFYLDLLNKAMNDIKWSNNPRLYLELAFIKMTDEDPQGDAKLWQSYNELENRIKKIEDQPVTVSPLSTEKPVDKMPIITKIEPKESVVQPTVIAVETTEKAPELETKQEPVIEKPILSEEPMTDTEKDYNLFEITKEDIDEIPLHQEISKEDNEIPCPTGVLSNTYDISFVEDVLNHGNRDDKNELIEQWHRLKRIRLGGTSDQYVSLFASSELKASSVEKIIVSFDNPSMCNRVMKPSVKKIVKEGLKKAFDRDLDYLALPNDVFNSITEEFAYLWKQGKRNIKLSPITHPDLRDVSCEVEAESIKTEEKIVKEAMDLFGDLVRIRKQ